MPNNFDAVDFMDEMQPLSSEYLDTRLARLKTELVQWMVSLLLVQASVTAVLFKLIR